MDNPRRFRVEILFSAGATATPLHMSESTRESDTTRLDTDPLFSVGRDGLTCTEVEDFFDLIISEGGKSEEESADVASTSTADALLKPEKLPGADPMKSSESEKGEGKESKKRGKRVAVPNKEGDPESEGSASKEASSSQKSHEVSSELSPPRQRNSKSIRSVGSEDTLLTSNGIAVDKKQNGSGILSKDIALDGKSAEKSGSNDDAAPRDISYKYFYLTVAMGSLLLGAGCLVMALSLTGGDRTRRRYNTRR
mmetsp:Transcript_10862/g.17399  ORF Transcript_10862/g.17399 Transcript_10862/m.17399 type:complete len:253 (-) Transcript_10862:1088-1846(-)